MLILGIFLQIPARGVAIPADEVVFAPAVDVHHQILLIQNGEKALACQLRKVLLRDSSKLQPGIGLREAIVIRVHPQAVV